MKRWKKYTKGNFLYYSKCSKISNTLKLRTPKTFAENNLNHPKNRTLPFFAKMSRRLKVRYCDGSLSVVPRALIFGMKHHLVNFYQVCSKDH